MLGSSQIRAFTLQHILTVFLRSDARRTGQVRLRFGTQKTAKLH